MKRSFRLALPALLMCMPLAAHADGISTLSDASQNFNGQSVTVRGVVSNFHQVPSQQGAAFATFSVCGGGCVRIFTRGNPGLSNGQRVTVSGTYAKVDRIDGYVYYNQIESDVLSIHADTLAGPSRMPALP